MLRHKYLVPVRIFLSSSGGCQNLVTEHIVLLKILLNYTLLDFLIIPLDLVFSSDPVAHQFVLLVCQVRVPFDHFQLVCHKLIDVLFEVLSGQIW